MAILSKIRERSLFLIIIIGLALFSFVLSGIFKSNSPLFNKNKNSIGEINGENISREEFAELVDQFKSQSGNRASQLQNVNAAWDNLVREKIYQSQLEKSGITVGEKDVWDEILRQPFVQNSPQFKNEAGLFDEEKFKEYLATLEDAQNDGEQGKAQWLSWLNYERNIKANLELKTYNDLINAGLGATLKEGERFYINNNTKLDVDYVYVPFTYISDSLVKVSDDEIKDYIKKHAKDFKTEASVDISFVKFDIKATPEDEAAIKNEVAKLINDREEYNKAAKTDMTVSGLANTKDVEDFFRTYNSDTPLDNKYNFKSNLNKEVADSIFNLKVGDVYGPYKEDGYYKITKLEDIKQMPDSVKARHILIPFAGALRADPSITKTEEEAKKTADSILAIVKNNSSKFANLAKEFSSDKVSGAKGGDLGWFTYDRMVPSFRDYCFNGKKGDIGVIKTDFGFHIINIEDQKNIQKAVKLATFTRKIDASEETGNDIYQKAETFSLDLVNGKDITELAKENNLISQPVIGLKAMDERVSTLGNQRQIVNWAFKEDTKVNDIKRFDIENGYAVVKINAKHKKGLGVGTSKAKIRTILMNQKKTKLIEEKMQANTLEDIAKTFDTKVNSSKAVSLGSPVLPGVGRSSDLVASIITLKKNTLYKNIETQKGIFAVKITKKEEPKVLENYIGPTTTVLNSLKSKSGKSYQVLKKLADIEDNRALFY